MKYALVNGQKTHAKDVVSGTIGSDLWFPDYKVKAHVGRYLQYWVYTAERPEFPRGYEPETQWHASWKELVDDQYTEVVCGANNEHRADILVGDQVVEIQKSRIDIRDAEERVSFYRQLSPNCRVIWIIDVQGSWSAGRLKTGAYSKEKRNIFELEWAKGSRHKWMVDLSRTQDTHVYFEFNQKSDKLIKVWVNNDKLWGSWVKKRRFFDDFLADYSHYASSYIHNILGF